MNILVVHCRYKTAGGEDQAVINDMRLLKEAGYRVVPYILSNDALDGMSAASKLKCVAEYIAPSHRRQKLIRIIRDNKIDRVWVHNTLWMVGAAAWEAALACHVPVIQTVHNYRLLCPCGICYRKGRVCLDCLKPGGLYHSVIHGCYRGSRALSAAIAAGLIRQRRSRVSPFGGNIYSRIRFVCLTEFQKAVLQDKLPGIDPGNIYIKHNICEASCDHAVVPYDRRENIFIYAGRLTESKGIRELLAAWRIIEENSKHARLMICGAGELEDFVRGYIKEKGLNNVDFKGELPNDVVREYLSRSKALIYPTRWFEGEPMTIVEAYTMGTPVIATDTGSVSGMVEDGITGRKLSADMPVHDLVDIVSDWDRTFSYDSGAFSAMSAIYSRQSAINAIKTIIDT